MNDTPAQTAAQQAEFEALRERWRQAKASGTTAAFAQELWDEAADAPPPPDSAYASEEERALYAKARELSPPKPSDLLDILPLYFGDEEGVSLDQVLDEWEASISRNGSAEGTDGPTS